MTYAANDITVQIGSATLLRSASLELRPGEIVAVAGPNGAGKTTLVRALAGDLNPTGHSITLDDRPIAEWPAAELARRRAVMSTDRTVAFAFTAREVALLGRMPLHGGDPTQADRDIVDELLAAVDCEHLADRVYTTLSTGERQRVQLARTIAQVTDAHDAQGGAEAHSPADGTEDRPTARFLLLDEPTSSLDPAHQHTAMRLLRAQAESGHGVLAVLHDLNLAAAYADRVVLMKEARVVAAGRPVEILRADLLEQVFDVAMLVLPHPHLSHPLVLAEPQSRSE